MVPNAKKACIQDGTWVPRPSPGLLLPFWAAEPAAAVQVGPYTKYRKG